MKICDPEVWGDTKVSKRQCHRKSRCHPPGLAEDRTVGAPSAQTSDHASSRAASGRGGTGDNGKSLNSEDQRGQGFAVRWDGGLPGVLVACSWSNKAHVDRTKKVARIAEPTGFWNPPGASPR